MDPLLTPALLTAWWPRGVGNTALTYNATLLLQVAVGFLATFGLGRALRLGVPAAGLAAAVYTLGPYAMGHLHHLNQLPSPWLPLSIWAVLVVGRGRAAAAWLWAVAGLLQVGAGIYGLAAWTLAMACLLPGTLLRAGARGRLALAVGVVLVGAAVVAWSLPYRAAAEAHAGFAREAGSAGPFAARIPDLWHVSEAHLLPWPPAPPGRPVLYPGVVWSGLARGGTRSYQPLTKWELTTASGSRPSFRYRAMLLIAPSPKAFAIVSRSITAAPPSAL